MYFEQEKPPAADQEVASISGEAAAEMYPGDGPSGGGAPPVASDAASVMHAEGVEFQTNVEDYVALRESILKQVQGLKGDRAQFKQAEKNIIAFLQRKGLTSFAVKGAYKMSIKKRARKGALKRDMIASTLREVVPPERVHAIIQSMESRREVSETVTLQTSVQKQ